MKNRKFDFEQDTRMNMVSLDIKLSDWGKGLSHSRRCDFCSVTFRLGGLDYDWFPLLDFLDDFPDKLVFHVICDRKRFVLKPRILGLFNFYPAITVNKLTKGSVANSNKSFNIDFTLNGISYKNALEFLQFMKDKTHRDLRFSIVSFGLSREELGEKARREFFKEGRHETGRRKADSGKG